ncbi:hypothetical protein BO71DRAFT_448227 [Aspergillus ellipticus CBS 707.79]|uniref:Uncharacterized protein n=1 Tax=Aspergillus ellipticus CBS 707.79 TaxID=1448320 RepID=A0A319DJN8_9EURO|nr:hypothetical protein BO71DRAFT_448227 [Aspergillus ellipticus CBS 707.79]
MPPVATPFRASRRSAGPQFASTPRFFLSQTPASQQASQGVDVDEDLPYATPVPAGRASKRGRQAPAPQKDIIEDSDDEPDDDSPYRPANAREGTSSRSSTPDERTEIDIAFEELFGSTSDRSKRRRVSWNNKTHTETPSIPRRRSNADYIVISSPDPPSPLADTHHPSPPATTHLPPPPSSAAAANNPPTPSAPVQPPYQTPKQAPPTRIFPKPVLPGPETPRPPSTPATAPLRRFILAQPPPSSQHQSTLRPSTIATTTPIPPSQSQSRTPAFVLPRSPSPPPDNDNNNNGDTIPTPFSPSSRALRRRGRNRQSQNYVPGGMAAAVRGWILEMGAKREQQQQQQQQPSPYAHSPDMEKYSIAVRISSVRQSALGSCGALAFVRGCPVGSAEGDEPGDVQMKNVLLLGPPATAAQSRRIPDLKAGMVVGVFRGLAWDVDLGESSGISQVLGTEMGIPAIEDMPQSDREDLTSRGKWHIGMEWEVVSPSLM